MTHRKTSVEEPCSIITQKTLVLVKGKLITPVISNIKSIENLFGKESWRLLRLCGIQGKSFLEKPASTWKDCSEFKMMQNIASNFVVVNDAAKRAVLLAKIIQNKLTKNSEVKHVLVNIVPELRKISDFKKKNLFKNINLELRNLYN